jgi:hypothetical protein
MWGGGWMFKVLYCGQGGEGLNSHFGHLIVVIYKQLKAFMVMWQEIILQRKINTHTWIINSANALPI